MVTRMDSVYNYVLCDCVLRKCRYTCGVWALRGLSAVTCVRRGGGEKTPAKPASRPARPALLGLWRAQPGYPRPAPRATGTAVVES